MNPVRSVRLKELPTLILYGHAPERSVCRWTKLWTPGLGGGSYRASRAPRRRRAGRGGLGGRDERPRPVRATFRTSPTVADRPAKEFLGQYEHPEFEASGRSLIGAVKVVRAGRPPGRAGTVEDLGGSSSVLVQASDQTKLTIVEVCPVYELLKIFERRRDKLRPEAGRVSKRIRQEE